jgi:V/A-type H+-transporting ATPase subunit E
VGLKEVKDDIVEEARQTADEIIDEAEEEAEKIVEQAKTEAEKIKEQAEKEIEDEKESLRKRRISNANMKARKEKLKAKEKKIREAFNEFKHELAQMNESQKEDFVENCFDRVSFDVGKVKASEDFQAAVEEQGFKPEDLDAQGIVLVSKNGERQQNFTVEKIVENYRDSHRKTVANKLFE